MDGQTKAMAERMQKKTKEYYEKNRDKKRERANVNYQRTKTRSMKREGHTEKQTKHKLMRRGKCSMEMVSCER
jgi:hypothetical protein